MNGSVMGAPAYAGRAIKGAPLAGIALLAGRSPFQRPRQALGESIPSDRCRTEASPMAMTMNGEIQLPATGETVALSLKDGGTLLTYNVEAQIGGKLAQLGQRLVNGAAKKMADQFFVKFAGVFAPTQA